MTKEDHLRTLTNFRNLAKDANNHEELLKVKHHYLIT